jgi:hypothetical protein
MNSPSWPRSPKQRKCTFARSMAGWAPISIGPPAGPQRAAICAAPAFPVCRRFAASGRFRVSLVYDYRRLSAQGAARLPRRD